MGLACQRALLNLTEVDCCCVWRLQDLVDGINYGLYLPPANGRAGKFLLEERLLDDYGLAGPVAQLEVCGCLPVLAQLHARFGKENRLHLTSPALSPKNKFFLLLL